MFLEAVGNRMQFAWLYAAEQWFDEERQAL